MTHIFDISCHMFLGTAAVCIKKLVHRGQQQKIKMLFMNKFSGFYGNDKRYTVIEIYYISCTAKICSGSCS